MKATVEMTQKFFGDKCSKCRHMGRKGNRVFCLKGQSKSERCIREGGSWFDSGFHVASEDLAVLIGDEKDGIKT
jgi:hypothetical protein